MLGLSGTAAPGPVALDNAASVTQTELVRLDAGDITFRQSALNMTYDRSDPTTPIINPVGTYPTDPSKFALRTYVVANQIARGRDYAGQITGKIPFETMGRTSAFQFGAKFRQERRTFDDYAFGRALKTGQTFTLADVAGRYADGSYVNCFPSAQLRLGLNEQTNFRVAVTTGIARPLYYDLAPHTSVTPGVLHGFGIDANATYVQSRSNIEGRVGKAFPRQANWNGHASLTYAKGIVSSRVTMQYNGPYIFTIGDRSRSVVTGDT